MPDLAFHLLQDLVEYFCAWQGFILPYETAAEQILRGFPSRLRQELKDDVDRGDRVAYDTAIWTWNATDYAKVPGTHRLPGRDRVEVTVTRRRRLRSCPEQDRSGSGR